MVVIAQMTPRRSQRLQRNARETTPEPLPIESHVRGPRSMMKLNKSKNLEKLSSLNKTAESVLISEASVLSTKMLDPEPIKIIEGNPEVISDLKKQVK